MKRASFLACTCLAFRPFVTASEYLYPADIEIDVLFPRNETYNNLTSFPVVLAVQDVKAAYRFGWELRWTLYSAQPGADDLDSVSGYGSYSEPLLNKFQWYYDDVAVVPMLGYNFTRLDPGPYMLEWEYYTTPCTHEPPNTIVYNIREVVASGSQMFSVVDDGSGLDFDIPTDECPLFGAIWSVYQSTSNYCPFLRDGETPEGDPCPATLQSRAQVECIRQYLFEGTFEVPNNETEACRESFERADMNWYVSLYELEKGELDRGSVDDLGDGDAGDDGAPDMMDQDKGNSTTESTQNEDEDNFAVSRRPSFLGMAVAAMAAAMVL
ncbi:hypothetical protein BDW66DRAFT_146471 [Aspergillus desertorum]